MAVPAPRLVHFRRADHDGRIAVFCGHAVYEPLRHDGFPVLALYAYCLQLVDEIRVRKKPRHVRERLAPEIRVESRSNHAPSLPHAFQDEIHYAVIVHPYLVERNDFGVLLDYYSPDFSYGIRAYAGYNGLQLSLVVRNDVRCVVSRVY